MRILTSWLREYVALPVDDIQLAEDLTLRGIAVEGISPAGELGHVYEMDITTNRVDAMNHYGVAREAAAIYGVPLPLLRAELPTQSGATQQPEIRVEAPELCGRFTARILRGVKIRPSDSVTVGKFNALGYKSISNAVDASNFVLHGMGHPTHAFDLDKIRGAVVVRLARKGEKLATLDGVERVLAEDDLIIADDSGAISLAGVMGGLSTSITPQTKNILIEAAWFDPASIRRTSRRHGLHTDASHRFERGADFAAAPLANDLVAARILRDGGTLHNEMVDIQQPVAAARTVGRAPIALRVSRVNRMLGTTIDDKPLEKETVVRILTSLGCELSAQDSDTLTVKLPSWRLDLEREIDLIEEVARVFGFNRLRNTLPPFAGAVTPAPASAQTQRIRSVLLGAGFNEAISSTFCSRSDAAVFSNAAAAVELGNPLSEEAGYLRPSLLPGMLTILAHNLNHGADHAALYEMGNVFAGDGANHYPRVDEQESLAIGLTGVAADSPLHPSADTAFFAMKGVIESLLSGFEHRSLYFDAFSTTPELQPSWLHPYRCTRVTLDGLTLGWLGELHPAQARARKLRQAVYLCELSLARLYRSPLRTPVAKELSRYPAVERDYSFVLPDAVTWSAVAAAIEQFSIVDLNSLTPREIFRDAKGINVPHAHYSLLLRAVFQSSEATLTEAELQQKSDVVVRAVEALGGKLRGEPRL